MDKSMDHHGSAPVVFADQPAELMIGPFTSKLTLGVVDDLENEVPRPVVTLVMPTPALFQMAREILHQAASASVKRRTVKALLDAAKAIESESDLTNASGSATKAPAPARKQRSPKT